MNIGSGIAVAGVWASIAAICIGIPIVGNDLLILILIAVFVTLIFN